MKKNKQILFTLSIALGISLSLNWGGVNAYASTTKSGLVESKKVPSDAIQFAKSKFTHQLTSLELDSKNTYFNKNEVGSYYLGTPFSIYSEDEKSEGSTIYYFPVISNDSVVALDAVTKTKSGDYTATFSKSFSNSLDKLLKSGEQIQVISVKNDIYAIHGDKQELLADDRSEAPNPSDEDVSKAKELLKSKNNSKDNNLVNVKEKIANRVYGIDPDAPFDYAALDVPLVSQLGQPWCAGATCASILNYKVGTNLTAEDVMNHVGGDARTRGLTNSEIKKVYADYGYNTQITSPLQYDYAQRLLKSNIPINAILRTSTQGHSMTIRGFYHFRGGDEYYSMIDPNLDYYVMVTAKNNGNDVYYILNNMAFYWLYSIY